jgi:hypothetical protein
MRTNFKTLDELKQNLIWGTYGKGGIEHCGGRCPKHPLQWVKLHERETSHLQAILRTQRQIIGSEYETAIHALLADRGVKPEKFSFEAQQEMFRKAINGEREWFRKQAEKAS